MSQFNVTYQIVTSESAEHGDFAECGFVVPGGYHENMEGIWGESAGKIKAECALTLREALELFGGPCEDSGRWFTEIDSRVNYQTGEDETRSLHPPENITASSYRRLRRLLQAH